MQIIEKEIKELKPYKNNPRNNDGAVEYVANSIKKFGFKVPILIDNNNTIIAGHTRYKAAKKLGLDSIPCIVADDLTEEQIKAFRIADNKVAEYSSWDWEKLDLELEDIKIIDMSMFGFLDTSYEEIDDKIENLVDKTSKTSPKKEKTIICPFCGEEIKL